MFSFLIQAFVLQQHRCVVLRSSAYRCDSSAFIAKPVSLHPVVFLFLEKAAQSTQRIGLLQRQYLDDGLKSGKPVIGDRHTRAGRKVVFQRRVCRNN